MDLLPDKNVIELKVTIQMTVHFYFDETNKCNF